MGESNNTSSQQQLVRVWDLPTRLFHATLIIVFIFLIVSSKLGGDWTLWHMRAGYLMAGLLIFRLCWGLVGSKNARFFTFLRSPRTTLRYIMSLFRGKPSHYTTHNPAGAIMVVIMIAAFTTQVLTGLVMSDDIFWNGPFYLQVSSELASWSSSIHRQMENFLLLLIALHIIAVLIHQFILKEPLIMAMIHGKKTVEDSATTTNSSANFSLGILVLAVLLMVAVVAWLWSLPN